MSVTAFVVKLRKNGDLISRHVWATSMQQACEKCKGKGKYIIGAKKVKASDIIGDVKTFKLIKEIIGKAPPKVYGIINEDTTLDSIVFAQKYETKEINRNKENNKNREELWYKNKGNEK